jgi:hypothetical protein
MIPITKPFMVMACIWLLYCIYAIAIKEDEARWLFGLTNINVWLAAGAVVRQLSRKPR